MGGDQKTKQKTPYWVSDRGKEVKDIVAQQIVAVSEKTVACRSAGCNPPRQEVDLISLKPQRVCVCVNVRQSVGLLNIRAVS